MTNLPIVDCRLHVEQAASLFKSVLRNMEQAGSLFYISKIGNALLGSFSGALSGS
jgi:hypothetical protein